MPDAETDPAIALRHPPEPKLLVTRAQAAARLSMSLTSFKTYVQPNVGVIRRGRILLIPVKELERWVTSNVKQPR